MSLNVTKSRKFLNESDNLVIDLTKNSEKFKNLARYEEISESIKEIVKNTFGSPSEVHFFGSRVIGVATESSDLDVFLKINQETHAFDFKAPGLLDKFEKVTKALNHDSKWLVQQSPYPGLPVIFATFMPMKFDCDINICNGIATGTSKLIAHLFAIQPEAVKLVHFTRMWFKTQGFDHLKGFTIMLLVVFYLQRKQFLPTVENVQSEVAKDVCEGKKSNFEIYLACS